MCIGYLIIIERKTVVKAMKIKCRYPLDKIFVTPESTKNVIFPKKNIEKIRENNSFIM